VCGGWGRVEGVEITGGATHHPVPELLQHCVNVWGGEGLLERKKWVRG